MAAALDELGPGDRPAACAVQGSLFDAPVMGPGQRAENAAAERTGKPGRPRGAKNLRSSEWVRYIGSRHAMPLEVMAHIWSMSPAELFQQLLSEARTLVAEFVGEDDAAPLRMSEKDAFAAVERMLALQLDAANKAIPYLHEKRGAVVDDGEGNDVPVLAVGLVRVPQDHGGGGQPGAFLDLRPRNMRTEENQTLSEAEDGKSTEEKSTDDANRPSRRIAKKRGRGRVMAELPPPQERQPWTDIGEIELERIINRGEDGGGYAPPGPCSAAFLQSDARVRGIMGPYGSGKTTTCIWDGMLKARTQPIARDGVRYLETAIVADTYGTLYRNTARTMHREFPKELGNWKGANERPFLFQLKVRDEFGLVYWTIDGLAVGDHAAEDAMDGFEVGHFVLNGASRLREDVLDYALGRVQRGGDRRKLGDEAFALKWTGVTLDWNPPDMDHWLYRRFVTEKPPHFEFYEQPGGREPDAENRDNLAADYYEAMVKDNSHNPQFIARFVDNRWGFAEAGDAVYPTYGRRHRADRELPFDPSLMLHVGIDGGDTLHPAAVFCQRTVEGQWRVLMELYLGRCGASAFAEHLVLCLQDNFPNARLCLHGDPAIDAGADKESGQLSFLDTIELALGCPVQLAPTNEFDPRREVVMQALGRPIEPGGLPGLIVSNQCPSLLAGFGGKYHFPKFKEGGREKTKDRPNKDHPWSDVHDALQYVLLSVEGLASVSAHGRRRDALDGPSRSPGRASAG
ncbi:Uncharacterized protein SCF082_LOCUS6711, partial [Durusdinium trenchii]